MEVGRGFGWTVLREKGKCYILNNIALQFYFRGMGKWKRSQAAPPLTIDEEKEENVAAPDDNDKKECTLFYSAD